MCATSTAGRGGVGRLPPSARLAYIRVRDPWQGGNLAEGYRRLSVWLAERGVVPTSGDLVGLSWERAKATPTSRISYDLGVTVGPDIAADGEIGVQYLPAVRAVELHCLSLPEIAAAWDHLLDRWLPVSPCEPDDLPVLKRFRRRPTELDADAWDVDCSIALRKRFT